MNTVMKCYTIIQYQQLGKYQHTNILLENPGRFCSKRERLIPYFHSHSLANGFFQWIASLVLIEGIRLALQVVDSTPILL